MRITKVYLDHFLSLKGILLDGLNDLNIIIGKNNAGKSNLVKGINAFFSLMDNNKVTNSNTPLNDKAFFNEYDTSTPITLALTFNLNTEEAQLLLNHLDMELPGAREYWAALENRNRITIVVKNVYYMNQYFAYLSAIGLGDMKNNPYTNELEMKTVFRLNNDSAFNFLQYYQEINKREERKEYLKREGLSLTPEEYQLIRKFDELENITPDEEARFNKTPAEIRKVIAESEDYQAFRQNLRKEVIILEHEIEYHQNKDLEFDVEVAGKPSRKLPLFVTAALSLLKNFSIIFIHDRKEPIGSEEAKKLFYLKNTREGYPKFERLRTILKELVDVNLEMWLNPDGTIDMDVDRMLLIFNGAGIRETLRVILDIYLRDADCILIEEPEVHLHPVVERTLFEHIKDFSQKTQMFITTHSPNFIDVSMPQTLFLLQKKKNYPSKAFNLNEEKLYQLCSAWGINDSEVFFREALVFVEHWHDESVLRILSTKTKYNLNKMNIQFIHFNGVEDIIPSMIDEESNYNQQKIKPIFLLHENSRNMDKVEEMRKRLPANCIILSKSEILNYLLASRPLVQFLHYKALSNSETKLMVQDLSDKNLAELITDAMENARNIRLAEELQKGGKIPSAIEINDIVKMVKNCLYNYVQIKDSFADLIEKKRLNWEEYKAEIAQDFLDIEEKLDKKWTTNKHALISGSDVLQRVANNYNTNFDALKGDGDRLARLVVEDEVDPELIKVFQTIANACGIE